MSKVCVIIPVYKAEAYIEKCTRTLFGQTLDNLEYIFVDDCSPDHSIEVMERVLNEFPNRKSQVKVIRHEVNQGVSAARQHGVGAADAEYIIHCDPDDYLELDMYEAMYRKAKEDKADIVLCDIFINDKRESFISKQKPHELSSGSLMQSIGGSSRTRIHGGLWNKMIKSSVYKNKEFPLEACYCEDVAILLDILKQDLVVSYISTPLYHYVIDTANSLAKTVTILTLEKDLKLIRRFENKIFNNPHDHDYQSSLAAMITWIIFNRAFKYGYLSDKEFKERYKRYHKYVNYNKQLPYLAKILLLNSMNGYLKISRWTFGILNRIRKAIDR